MITLKNIPIKGLWRWSAKRLFYSTLWAIIAVVVYEYTGASEWLKMPWLPISMVGTAVAFYVGFKNNSAYDRMWEARKIWGAIVNDSRSWGSSIRSFVSNRSPDSSVSDAEVAAVHKRLVYRHLAWLYALRSQLLAVKPWEHAAQKGSIGKEAVLHKRDFGVGLITDEITQRELDLFLNKEEFAQISNFSNMATQLLDQQYHEIVELRDKNMIDGFRLIALQQILNQLFGHQGKAERIKNYPLPRQYATSSRLFVSIFQFLLPFGMASEFSDLGPYGIWFAIPFIIIVDWVFGSMEQIGDTSENPFQGMPNDVPMYSLCRTIEIDLREMLREQEIPEPVMAMDGILM